MQQSSPKACDMAERGSPEFWKASVVLPVSEYPEIICLLLWLHCAVPAGMKSVNFIVVAQQTNLIELKLVDSPGLG
eukprot:2097357-Ditylum_brightwellii.AAC.1